MHIFAPFYIPWQNVMHLFMSLAYCYMEALANVSTFLYPPIQPQCSAPFYVPHDTPYCHLMGGGEGEKVLLGSTIRRLNSPLKRVEGAVEWETLSPIYDSIFKEPSFCRLTCIGAHFIYTTKLCTLFVLHCIIAFINSPKSNATGVTDLFYAF